MNIGLHVLIEAIACHRHLYHLFGGSKGIRYNQLFKYTLISFIESITGTNEPNKLTCSQLSGFKVQFLVHCTSIAEGHGIESRWSHLIFSGDLMRDN